MLLPRFAFVFVRDIFPSLNLPADLFRVAYHETLRPGRLSRAFALAYAGAAREAPQLHLFDPLRPGARVSALKDYPADAQREQAMHESRFPLHHRIDYYSGGGLCATAHIEMKYKQPGTIELLVDDE